MGDFFNGVKEFFTITSYKKSSTLSGSLVYFTLIGIVPIAYISSLVLAFFGAESEIAIKLLSYPPLNEVVYYVFQTANKMGAQGNILVFLIALYSSANIFYHLKLSGEIIYNYSVKNNLFLRVISIVVTFLGVCFLSLLAIIYIFLLPLISKTFGDTFSYLISGGVLLFTIFFVAVFINFYTCPYKIKLVEVVKGSLYTTLFCVISTILFFFYISNFARYDEIYGKIATIIVFLTWLYLMVRGFVDGITLNVYFMSQRKKTNRAVKGIIKGVKA